MDDFFEAFLLFLISSNWHGSRFHEKEIEFAIFSCQIKVIHCQIVEKNFAIFSSFTGFICMNEYRQIDILQ